MERVRNEAVEVRRDGKAELAGSEPSTSEEKTKGERIVRWERFLPRRSLRVLVVEVDDSTRQLVSSLLRSCSYQVVAVGDGLLAWVLLEDPSNIFDLVLTEVAMPSLSGIALLCKITSHETLKNIPVIMTSSLDSMKIVFNCLSKGAVDFLVKPVRKNELQNLWQHVWRRCHISSGSVSGSRNQITAQSKSEAGSGNNTDGFGGSENASSGLNIREGSDNGSGTQVMPIGIYNGSKGWSVMEDADSSTWQVILQFGMWTNRYLEVESSHQRGKWEPYRSYDNMFSQVTKPKKENIQYDWRMQLVETSGKQDAKACGKAIPDDALHQDLESDVPRRDPTDVECLREESALYDQACQKKEADHSASCGEGNQLGAQSVNAGSEPLMEAIDLIGTMSSKPQSRHEDQEDGRSRQGKIDTGVNRSHGEDKNLHPELELTLNCLQANWNEKSKHGDKYTLRQPDALVFSRYNMGGTHFPFPCECSSPINVYSLPKEHRDQYCLSSENTGSLHLAVPFEQVGSSKGSGGDAPDQYQLSQSANIQDTGSYVIGPSVHDALPSPVLMKDETRSMSPVSLQVGLATPMSPEIISFDGVPPAYNPALHPIFYSYPGVPVWGLDTPLKAERGDARDSSADHKPHIVPLQDHDHSHPYNDLRHHHIQHRHHHHHHHHEGHQYEQHAKQDECAVDNAVTTSLRDCSSNMAGNTLDGNYGESGSSNGHGSNGNANDSASRSNNNGSNVHNGQSSAAVTPGTNGGSGTGNMVTSGTSSGVGNNQSARREKALTKFRQKRKERCFENKV